METRVSARLTPPEGRHFGLVVGAAFLALGGISFWRGHHITPLVLWTLGGTLIVAGLLIPARLGPVHRRWMALALLISRVTTPILMGLVFFSIFTPMGLLRRAFGRNALARPTSDTFWVERRPGPGRRSDLSRQF